MTTVTEYAHILPRRGTAAQWTSVNPVLLMGEEGLETDTGRTKRGDGVTVWAALPYDLDTTSASSTYVPAVVAAGAGIDPSGVVDSTAGLQAKLTAAAGGTLFIPEGVYSLASELSYDVAALGGLSIRGAGVGTVLRLTGAANKGIRLYGAAGVTSSFASIAALKVISATSGISPACIHLDGLAAYGTSDLIINGANKATVGLLLTGTQQGQISGGFIQSCTTGLKLEASGAIHSNAAEVHGISFSDNPTSIAADSVDDIFIHGNHLVSKAGGTNIVLSGTGFGLSVVRDNHLELHTVGLSVSGLRCHIAGNSFMGGPGVTDLSVLSGNAHTVTDNLFTANVSFAAAASKTRFIGKTTGGTITNASVDLVAFANHAYSGTPLPNGQMQEKMSIKAPLVAPGDILTLDTYGYVGGPFGQTITGAGGGADADVYLRLGGSGPAVVGNRDSVDLRLDSSVGGNTWGKFAEASVADDTALLVRRNLAGVFSLQRVTQGAVDSGGAGFRVLRIPN